jgi:N-carbamoylputrescine amidase
MSDTFSLGLVQMSIPNDAVASVEKAVEGIGEAAKAGAQIVVLPELFRTPYFCQRQHADLFDLAEPIPGPTYATVANAAKVHGVTVVASLFEKRAPGLYHNTAAIIGPKGDLIGLYRKNHIPDDPLFFEKYYFTPGYLGFKAFDTPHARLGVLVCWDQWYPEAARLTALEGAEVIVYPTAIGWHPSEKEEHGVAQVEAWQLAQRAHGLANGVYIAAVNRHGHEGERPGGIEFWGHSFVSDPYGRMVVDAGETADRVLVQECSRSRIEDVRRNWPFLRDRRIDIYGGITKRFGGN